MKKSFLSLIFCIFVVSNLFAQQWNTYQHGSRWKTHGVDMCLGGCIGSFGTTEKMGDIISSLSYYNKVTVKTPNRGLECNIGLTVFNVYADIHFREPNNINSCDVDIWENESSYFAWHLGYTIPVYSRFSITPILGMGIFKIGDVDGYDWYASSSGIHNRFCVDDIIYAFEYGCKIDFTVFEVNRMSFTLNAKATNHAISGGLGIYFRTY